MKQFSTIKFILLTSCINKGQTLYICPYIRRIFTKLLLETGREIAWRTKPNFVCYLINSFVGALQ